MRRVIALLPLLLSLATGVPRPVTAAAVPPLPPPVGALSVWEFTGFCTDCSAAAGTPQFGHAILVLQGYAPSTPLTPANFYSLYYSSNLIMIHEALPLNVPTIFGGILTLAPGGDTVFIRFGDLETVETENYGIWCAGLNAFCGDDIGTQAAWSPVPEPTTVGMFGLSLAGLALARRRRGQRGR